MTDRALSPRAYFYLDTNPRHAALWLSGRHLTAECRAMGVFFTNVASMIGCDMTSHPRDGGAYKETPLTLAGCWAVTTDANWAWYSAYATWLFVAYRERYGKEHRSRDYVDWARNAIGEDLPPAGPLTCPPVPGHPGGTLSTEEAAALCRRWYVAQTRPQPGTCGREDAELMSALENAVRAEPGRWDAPRIKAVLRTPGRAIDLMPDSPVIRAITACLMAGIPLTAIYGQMHGATR